MSMYECEAERQLRGELAGVEADRDRWVEQYLDLCCEHRDPESVDQWRGTPCQRCTAELAALHDLAAKARVWATYVQTWGPIVLSREAADLFHAAMSGGREEATDG